jgi:hypothetical protein
MKLLVSAISDCDVVESVFAAVIDFFKKILTGEALAIPCDKLMVNGMLLDFT